MQTHFTPDQLLDPQIREADAILRKCVHCGFCVATCPTYVLTGDERDSPRGRIWLMRELLESPETVSAETGFHLDRCLGCMSCMTTCPSGVDYNNLLDIGRERIERKVERPLADRVRRRLLARIIPHAARFHLLLRFGRLAALFAPLMPTHIRAALTKVPSRLAKLDRIGGKTMSFKPGVQAKKHVILLAGCAQRALDPAINASTVRVLNKLGVEVTVRAEAHCCGALAHHIGEAAAAAAAMRATLGAWRDELQSRKVDAILVNASGCGTMIKDYAHITANSFAANVGGDANRCPTNQQLVETARQVSAMTMDICEFLAELTLADIVERAREGRGEITYHSACSLQHGQKIHDLPMQLLRQVGFVVRQPQEPHLCCGSAGVYNILQPEMADGLRSRKLDNLKRAGAPFVAAGNIGCITQLDGDLPVRHTIQYIDWACGGPPPV